MDCKLMFGEEERCVDDGKYLKKYFIDVAQKQKQKNSAADSLFRALKTVPLFVSSQKK